MSFENEVSEIQGCQYFPDKDLTTFTTIRLSSRGDLVEVSSIGALQQLLPMLRKFKKEYLVIGWGANQILPPISQKIILHLSLPFDLSYLNQEQEEYLLPASLGLNHLTAHAVKFGLKGWDVFTGIPASLGGAIYMNAGTNLGEIGSLIKSVQIVSRDGSLRTAPMNEKSFSYRKNHFLKEGDVIVGAVIKNLGTDATVSEKIKDYLAFRKKSQPLSTKNCGCVFKNPNPGLQAGRLIDLIGLKGVQLSGLRVSNKHANFIENTGNANWDQFSNLIELIKWQMDHFYGIEFELEVKIPYH